MKSKRVLFAAIAAALTGAVLTPVIQNGAIAQATDAESLVASGSKSNARNYFTTALEVHNRYRARHGVPALARDPRLERSARTWASKIAKKGKLEHSGAGDRNNAGENLAFFANSAPIPWRVAVERAVGNWYNEIGSYNYSRPGFAAGTGHFTQVVWKNSTSLGCGVAEGEKITRGSTQLNTYYVVCHYGPAGNVQGQFPENVLPSR
ncbi:MAG: CAP family protein [Cyanobacteria bacterium P01_D01_bin.73]